MDNRSIGVFDSGLGGLTAVKELMKELPYENLIYFGDTGRVPYGTRSDETIIKYSRSDVRFLESFQVKMIVIACGTVSSVALPILKKEFDTPILGVVEATAAAAVRRTHNCKIGVIGTPGTIKSGAYERWIKQADPRIETYSRACPLFVPLVENGHFDTQVAYLVAEEYLSELREKGVDTLILGCTHYPHLKQVIRRVMGDGVALIDPGVEIARYLKREFDEKQLHSDTVDAEQYRYFVSDSIEGFEALGSTFLERSINGRVKKIDIETYEK